MSNDNIPDNLLNAWIAFGAADTNELPTPLKHKPYNFTRQMWWARYREAKHLRWIVMYGLYRVPWIEEKAFGALIDAHYMQEIAETIDELPAKLPIETVPSLRKRKLPSQNAQEPN